MSLQLRKHQLFGVGALIIGIIVGVLLYRTPTSVSNSDSAVPAVKPVEVLKVAASEEPAPLDNSKSADTGTPAVVSAISEKELKPFENKTELTEFKVLKQKVFLTEKEKEQRKNLTRDRVLLENLGNLFKFPAPYQDLESQQNVAVDLLLEAIKSGDAETARRVLKDLIADPTIENNQLSPAERQNLAGAKAEVLYQWSALEPDRATEMQSALPGPVSRKIWKNVLSQQKLNEAESAVTK